MSIYSNLYVLDDDKICNFLHKSIVQKHFPTIQVTEFTDAMSILECILENINHTEKLPNYLFLDINMPQMNAWDFLDEYLHIKSPVLKACKVVIVTSSSSPSDIEKSKEYPFLKGYYIKPLKEAHIRQIFTEL